MSALPSPSTSSNDYNVPPSRPQSPNYHLRLAENRELFDKMRNGNLIEFKLLSTFCKGQFEISPWNLRVEELNEIDRGRGIPKDMVEWEEWEEEEKRDKENVVRDKGKGKLRKTTSFSIELPGNESPRRMKTTGTELANSTISKTILTNSGGSESSERVLKKSRSLFGSSSKPFLTSTTPKKNGNFEGESLKEGGGVGASTQYSGRNEIVLAEGGCTQMILKDSTQYPTASTFPSPSFPIGLPTSTRITKSSSQQILPLPQPIPTPNQSGDNSSSPFRSLRIHSNPKDSTTVIVEKTSFGEMNTQASFEDGIGEEGDDSSEMVAFISEMVRKENEIFSNS